MAQKAADATSIGDGPETVGNVRDCLDLRPVFCPDQSEIRQLLFFAMRDELEALRQQRLHHTLKLLAR